MSKYRKKPVEIEARLFDGSNSFDLIKWIGRGASAQCFGAAHNCSSITIPTLEGDHTASKGDWIIKGVKGEFYPCKPDIFEMTYDRVDEDKT